MKRWHGLGHLLEAFRRLYEEYPGTRLLLVGDGPVREELAAEARAQGLEKAVKFTGAVVPADVPGLLASMDVAVAPYPKSANFYFSPLKVYEYMAAGLPVLASRLGQLEKLIEHEVNGLLVPAGDIDALVRGLERMRLDPSLRQSLGKAARTKVLRNHTWDAVTERIFQVAGLGLTCEKDLEKYRMTNDE